MRLYAPRPEKGSHFPSVPLAVKDRTAIRHHRLMRAPLCTKKSVGAVIGTWPTFALAHAPNDVIGVQIRG